MDALGTDVVSQPSEATHFRVKAVFDVLVTDAEALCATSFATRCGSADIGERYGTERGGTPSDALNVLLGAAAVEAIAGVSLVAFTNLVEEVHQ